MPILGVIASSAKGAPGIPTIGTATDVGTSRAYNNGAATVTFTAGAGATATSFTATSSPGGFTATGASSPLTVAGLQSSTSYTFTVTATNAAGTSAASAASNSITATTVPQAPTIGTPTPGTTNVNVAFTANATGGKTVTTFTATGTPSGSATNSASPINVTGLTAGTSYTFTVTATNANGTSTASAASAAVVPGYYGTGWLSTTTGILNRRWSVATFDRSRNLGFALARVGTGGTQPNECAVSTNGVTWTSPSIPITGTSWNAGFDFSSNTNTSVAINGQGTTQGMYTTNGVTWNTFTLSTTNQYTLAGTNQANAWISGDTSNNATLWTTSNTYSQTQRTVTQGTAKWNMVGYSYTNNLFVAIGGGTTAYAYSTNGSTWTTATAGYTFNSLGTQKRIVEHKGTMVAGAYNQTAYSYSTNGTSWNQGTLPSAILLQACQSNGTVVIFQGEYSSDIFTSTNGITWTTVATGTADSTWGGALIGATTGSFAGRFMGLPMDANAYYYSTT
jgi:trimeric autotransporter adhesin